MNATLTLGKALEILGEAQQHFSVASDGYFYTVCGGCTLNANDAILAYSNVEAAHASLPSSIIVYPCYGIALLLPVEAPDEEIIAAAEIVAALENYPVLDDEDYSEREQEAINEAFADSAVRADVAEELGMTVEELEEAIADRANGDADGRVYEAFRCWALQL